MRLISLILFFSLSSVSLMPFAAKRAMAQESDMVSPFSVAGNVIVGAWFGTGWVFMTASDAISRGIERVALSMQTRTKYYQLRCPQSPWFFADFGIDIVGCQSAIRGIRNNPPYARQWGLPGSDECVCVEI